MKLVFYSGGEYADNKTLNKKLLELTGVKKPQITFIPASSYFAAIDFEEFAFEFQKYRINKIINFPVDVEFSEVLKEEVLSSDIIFLGGGNTYYFLKRLKLSGMFEELKKFVKRGGVLAGLSAGGIIMTKNIKTAGFPEFDRDDNDENLRNLTALNLVDFDFFPHYRNSKRYDKELLNHSNNSDRVIHACSDGQGIIVNEANIEFIGKSFFFHKNHKKSLK